ncbi:MAG: YihY/virulence factor BrkB family protein [Solirubrobacterales bacterium]
MERVSSPSDLTVRAWWHALRDAAKAFRARNLADRAASLTYYSVLSVFPGMIVLVSLLGVFGGPQTADSVFNIIDELGPSSAVETFRGPVEDVTENSGAAGVALVVGVALALYSASGYVGAFMRASNEIYDVAEERPFWKQRPLQLAITFAMVLALTAVMLALVLTGPLAEAIGEEVGVGDTARTAFAIVKWPLLFAVVVGVIGGLYRFAPDARRKGFSWVLPGSLLATALWLVASAGFAVYIANFDSYSNTYGALAGVIVFLVWLWLTNVAVVFGAQFAAELERTGRAAEHAAPPGEFAPFVPADGDPPPPAEGYSTAPAARTGAGSTTPSSAGAPESGTSGSAPERRK